MGLKSLVIPTLPVEVSGDEGFVVRGLTSVDLRVLMTTYASDMSEIFKLLAGGGNGLVAQSEDAAAMVGTLIHRSPAICAMAIALASGEEDAFENALLLPFTVQVDAITKIAKLTFASEGSAKKFFQTVMNLIGSAKTGTKK
jgi:hypothetical protein